MNNNPSNDIIFIGDIAGFDLMFAEYFRAAGLRCKVLRPLSTGGSVLPNVIPYTQNGQKFFVDEIVYYENRSSLLKELRDTRCIASIGGALPVMLGRKYWPFRNLLRIPPVIHFSTGSDIMERAIEDTVSGQMYREYLHFTRLNVMLAYPQALKNLQVINPPNTVFLRYPYYLLENKNMSDKNMDGRIKLFHPSNLDWNSSEKIPNRVSTKGNDRFFKGLAKAITSGLDAECIVLERGKDKDQAHKLVKELGLDKSVVWKPTLTRDELIDEMVSADIVVDQFDVGGLGGITAEAMSLGKAVMIYIHEESARVLYPEMPPVLNCQTEEQIKDQLLLSRDKAFLNLLGQKAHDWIYKYHSSESVMGEMLFYYSMITGHSGFSH
jgi:hypothetical protein